MSNASLNNRIVLSLNRAWQVIGHRTVKQALMALNEGNEDLPTALRTDIAYSKSGDNTSDFDRPLARWQRGNRVSPNPKLRPGKNVGSPSP